MKINTIKELSKIEKISGRFLSSILRLDHIKLNWLKKSKTKTLETAASSLITVIKKLVYDLDKIWVISKQINPEKIIARLSTGDDIAMIYVNIFSRYMLIANELTSRKTYDDPPYIPAITEEDYVSLANQRNKLRQVGLPNELEQILVGIIHAFLVPSIAYRHSNFEKLAAKLSFIYLEDEQDTIERDRFLIEHTVYIVRTGAEYSDRIWGVLHTQIVESSIEMILRAQTQRKIEPGNNAPTLITQHELSELVLLSSRKKSRYVLDNKVSIEHRFEDLLSLTITSFGYSVILAKPGTRRIDLICISSHQSTTEPILIEAKTSSHSYDFPAKDERALLEYIESTSHALRGMRNIRLVLIVCPDFTAKAARKIKKIEKKLHLCIRGIKAIDLAEIRITTPGIIPSDFLVECAEDSAEILGTKFKNCLKYKLEKDLKAYHNFVDLLVEK